MDSTIIARLAQINVDDLLVSLGAAERPALSRLLRRIFLPAGRRFAEMMADYDDGVALGELATGACRLLNRMYASVTAMGAEYIPDSGPVLILANHPGMTDTLALFASIRRADIKIVAAERPFLQALPATSQHLIFVSDDNNHRIASLRSIAAHLRAGGGIITFPAGNIEPDPACMPGARQALESWSDSTGFFARLAPETVIIPAIVSGVIAAQSLRHPLTRLRRQQRDRERLAAALQLIAATYRPWIWPTEVQVCFGAPLAAQELAELRDPRVITRRVIEYTRQFIPETARLA